MSYVIFVIKKVHIFTTFNALLHVTIKFLKKKYTNAFRKMMVTRANALVNSQLLSYLTEYCMGGRTLKLLVMFSK